MADPHLSTAGRAYQGQVSTGVSAIPQPPPRPVNPSCFGSITSARTAAEETAARVRQIVDRLAGPYPQSPASPDELSSSGGLCGLATADALGVQAALTDINEQIDRLERALP